MPIIFVHNLIVSGTHGAHLPVQAGVNTAVGKDFKIDMEIEVGDISTAAASDNIADVYDYRDAVRIVRSVIEGPSVHLIETLTSRICEKVLKHPKVQNIKLTLSKRELGDQFDSGITVSLPDEYRTEQ